MEKQSRSQETETKAWRQAYKKICQDKISSDVINLQNIFTPYDLCYDVVRKLEAYSEGGLKDKTFCVFNLEFVEVLCYLFGIERRKVWFVTDCEIKKRFAEAERYNGINVKLTEFESFLEEDWDMKFDVVIGNPPYQAKSDKSKTKTQQIWHKFVKKFPSICKDDGYLVFIHPSGWRSNGKFYEDAKILKEKQIEYLEIHDEHDGIKTFKTHTRYDWYVLKNCPITHNTTIKDQDGVVGEYDISIMPFIPNAQIKKVISQIAKNGDEKIELLYSCSDYETRKPYMSKTQHEKIELLYSRSDYGTDKPYMSKTQHDNFVYPVVYTTSTKGATFWYSSTKDKGHFGISKLILNVCRPIGFIIDEKGEYGISQWCVGIVGNHEYLKMVANIIKNQKTNGFSDFMEACHLNNELFNKDVMGLLKKDFWKEFNEHR